MLNIPTLPVPDPNVTNGEPPPPKDTPVPVLFPLLADPLKALPPKVFPLTLADPDVADWLLLLLIPTLLVCDIKIPVLDVLLPLLYDPGPVVPIVIVLAAAVPSPITAVDSAILAYRKAERLIYFPSFIYFIRVPSIAI